MSDIIQAGREICRVLSGNHVELVAGADGLIGVLSRIADSLDVIVQEILNCEENQ